MGLPQPQQPVTLEVLAFQIGQVHEGLDRVLTRLDGTASKDEVADLRSRLRVIEDDRIAARAVLALVALLGVGGVGAILKFVLTA